MLSNTSKYALRALIYLGKFFEEGKKIGIKKITEDLGISGPFLGKILQFLVRQKLLVSIKGPHGGFSLAMPPGEISLFDIIVKVEGEEYFSNCIIGLEPCTNHNSEKPLCPVHVKYSELREDIAGFYKKTSLLSINEDLGTFEDLIKL